MDILKDKNYKQFDYTCRYSGVPYYYNKEDKKYIFGLGTNLKKDSAYVLHQVKETDTLDYLALKYYNNPTYYWIICDFNRIQNPFDKPIVGTHLMIPSFSDLKFDVL